MLKTVKGISSVAPVPGLRRSTLAAWLRATCTWRGIHGWPSGSNRCTGLGIHLISQHGAGKEAQHQHGTTEDRILLLAPNGRHIKPCSGWIFKSSAWQKPRNTKDRIGIVTVLKKSLQNKRKRKQYIYMYIHTYCLKTNIKNPTSRIQKKVGLGSSCVTSPRCTASTALLERPEMMSPAWTWPTVSWKVFVSFRIWWEKVWLFSCFWKETKKKKVDYVYRPIPRPPTPRPATASPPPHIWGLCTHSAHTLHALHMHSIHTLCTLHTL